MSRLRDWYTRLYNNPATGIALCLVAGILNILSGAAQDIGWVAGLQFIVAGFLLGWSAALSFWWSLRPSFVPTASERLAHMEKFREDAPQRAKAMVDALEQEMRSRGFIDADDAEDQPPPKERRH